MSNNHLRPVRHAQSDLFVCDITDVILKDDLASMEHPFYSLSKKPDREPRRYDYKNKWIEFRPSIKGMPTIYDKDLIIYAISQLVAGRESGRELSRTVEIDPYAFLVFTERSTGGRDYDALCDSLDRLDGTRFRTNVLYDGTRKDQWMGLIDKAALDTDDRTGKPRKLTITLSEVVFNAVEEMAVLTLHRDYFRLRKPIERRAYELARKHCGRQAEWKISLENLHTKSGSRASRKEFRRAIKGLVQHSEFPDYDVRYDAEKDQVVFVNRGTVPLPPSEAEWTGNLDNDVYHDARKAAPGWDVRELERKWRIWVAKQDGAVQKPEASFIGFCRSWAAKRGRP